MMSNMQKQYGSKKGSGSFSAGDEAKGYKVLCDANDLAKMDVDRVEYAGPTLAKRVQPKKYRRSESSKGTY
jgi:hypothetical protein